MTPVPLAEVIRGGWVESLHAGWAVLADAEGNLVGTLGAPPRVLPRSSLKPFQAIPLLETGIELPPEAWAIACSSHSGTEAHLPWVRLLLDRSGCDESALRCGRHLPLHEPTAEAMQRRGESPTSLHSNCSGKHAGMLLACRLNGWDPATYDRLDHPLQVAIRQAIAHHARLSPDSLEAGVDGCGVPAWRMPLDALARAFARLGADPELAPLAEAMAAHPELVAGEGRFDTQLMRAAAGRLVSKAGAEAMHAGVCRRTGRGWAVKIADGNRRAIPPVVLDWLHRHDLLEAGEFEQLGSLRAPEIRNYRGDLVGQVRVVSRYSASCS